MEKIYTDLVTGEDSIFTCEYDILERGGVLVTVDPEKIKRNIKTFDVQNDFNVKNQSVVKRLNTVLVTTKDYQDRFIQFTIDSDSKKEEVPENLRETLEIPFMVSGNTTMEDLSKLFKIF